MNFLIEYAIQFIGVPYKWGGSTHDGIDCSGLVHELLLSVGIVQQSNDRTAQSLFDHCAKLGQTCQPKAGALVFYGKDKQQVTHVAFLIDEHRVIEAGGGGHLTLTRADAERDLAFVRMRPYQRRNDIVGIMMPDYPAWVI